jgi:hypothetical protein
MIRSKLALAPVVAALLLLQGCASIVSGQNQSIAVQTVSMSGPVSGALCRLSNNKGSWDLVSPGTTTVQRSFEALSVRCEKEGLEPALETFASATKAMAFGNVLIGGVIGASIDVSTGAAYDYPGMITITFRGASPAPASAAGPAAAVAAAAPPPSVLPSALAVGDLLEYQLEDAFTGQKRVVQRRVSEVSATQLIFGARERIESAAGATLELAVPALGDLDEFEPPRGWLPAQPVIGQVERLEFMARDGRPGSRMDLEIRTMAPTWVQTPAGSFQAWRLEIKGYAMRPTALREIPHSIRMTVWVDGASRRPVRFESDVSVSGNNAFARTSRERVELLRFVRVGAG